jgi:hypothetical protein
MAEDTLDSIKWIRRTVMVNFLGAIVGCTVDIGKMANSMDMQSTQMKKVLKFVILGITKAGEWNKGKRV